VPNAGTSLERHYFITVLYKTLGIGAAFYTLLQLSKFINRAEMHYYGAFVFKYISFISVLTERNEIITLQS